MASDLFGDVVRKVRLRASSVPALLVKDFCIEVYRELVDMGAWSWLRSESEFILNDSKTAGTVAVTRSSAAVVGTGTAFASTDVGRQFRTGSGSPIYSISAVADATHLTLDRPYGATTASTATYTILDAYVTMPADFGRFLAVLDTANNWQLRFWYTENELNAVDSQRSSSGTPTVLASRRLSTLTATAGQAQYELWPYTTAAKNYPYYYIRRSETLTEDTYLLGPLASRGDVIITGALAKIAEWPGAEGRSNPYFNLGLAANLKAEYAAKAARLEVEDQELYPTWLDTSQWMNKVPFAPLDARFYQEHDVPSMIGAFGYY